MHAPLGASIDDWAIAEKKIVITDPLGQAHELQGDIVFEYKVTSIHEPTLPLYKGPVQVQGQMMCTNIGRSVVMVFNIKTWEIQYWPIFPHKETQDLSVMLCVSSGAGEKKKYFTIQKKFDFSLVYSEAKDDTKDLSGNNQIGDAINTWHEGNLEIKSERKRLKAHRI